MKIKAIVFGLTGIDTAPIVRTMKAHPNFEKVVWFGIVPDADINTYEAYKFVPDHDYSINLPEDYLGFMQLVLGDFMLSSSRRAEVEYNAKTYTLGFGSAYASLHHFSRYCYLIYEILTKNKINLIIIDGVPHTSIDVLLTQAAKYFNLKTLFLYQPNIPNKFMYFSELKGKGVDFSLYYSDKERIVKNHDQQYILNELERPFYMQDFSAYFYDELKILNDLMGLRSRLLPKFLTTYLFTALFSIKLIKSINNLKALDALASILLKHVKYKIYAHNLKQYSQKDINFSLPYVYFPLNFQPELTTECLAGTYIDIISAVEKVRCFIPQDWKIYVKDHSAQYEFARDRIFFDRLMAIPNIILIDRFQNPFDLIRNAQFVACVNGTVAWEAIHMGKKAINFGTIYYQGLPGIFTYSNDLKFEDFIKVTIKKEEVERAINTLIGRMETGVVCADYSAMVEDFDPQVNAQLVTDFIMRFFFNSHESLNHKTLAKVLAS